MESYKGRFDPTRFEDLTVTVEFHCHSACRFCIVQEGMNYFKGVPFELFQAAVDDNARSRRYRRVTFTGGEVTLEAKLFDYVRYARDVGRFEHIRLQTNGRLCADAGFARRLVDAGIDEFFVSLHGHDAATQDHISRRPGSFDEAMAGMENLAALDVCLMTNTVLTTLNQPHLSEIVETVRRLAPVRMEWWNYLPMEDYADERELLAPMSRLAPSLREALARAAGYGIETAVKYVPRCLLGDHAASQDNTQSDVLIVEEFYDVYPKFACVYEAKCEYAESCLGLHHPYITKYGWEEDVLVPYPRSRAWEEPEYGPWVGSDRPGRAEAPATDQPRRWASLVEGVAERHGAVLAEVVVQRRACVYRFELVAGARVDVLLTARSHDHALAHSASFNLHYRNVRADLDDPEQRRALAALVKDAIDTVRARDPGGMRLDLRKGLVGPDALRRRPRSEPERRPAGKRLRVLPSTGAVQRDQDQGRRPAQTREPDSFPTPYHLAELDRETALDDASIAAFRRDGHLLVRRALPRDLVVAARPLMLERLAAPPEEASSKDEREDAYARAFRQLTDLGHRDATVRAFAYGRRVLRMAADLMGVQAVRLFCEDWLVKEPGAGITPWHQDEVVFPFDAEQTITCWIPLQDVGSSDGLMRFATGSHRLGLAEIEDISDTSEREYDRIIEQHALAVSTQPPVLTGDVSFHHGRTIHGAFANESDRSRVVLALHCFAEGARIKRPTTPKMARLLATAQPDAAPGDPARSPRWPLVFERDRVRVEVVERPTAERFHLRARWLPDAAELRDVWIEGGRIRLAPVAEAVTVAPPGGYLTTGLVECHGHISYPQDEGSPVGTPAWMNGKRAEYAATGVLLVRDMGAVGDEITGLTDRPGLPRVQSCGTMILRYDEFPFTRTEPEALVATCVRRMEAGARWVKIFADWSSDYRGRVNTGFRGDDALTYAPELLAAAVEAVHARGGRVAAHCFTRAGAEASIRAGVDSLEHGWGVDEGLLDEMVKAGIAWAPLVGIGVHMWRVARRDDQGDRMLWVQDAMAALARHLPLAVDRGVRLLAGTDMFPEVTVSDEVLQLCELGVEPAAAVASASWAARAWLGEWGIEEGAPADLVLFREDPRADPRVLALPELILSGGERVTPSTAHVRPRPRSWRQREEP